MAKPQHPKRHAAPHAAPHEAHEQSEGVHAESEGEGVHEPPPTLSRPYRKAMEALLAPILPEHDDSPNAPADQWRDLFFAIEKATAYVKSYRDADRKIVRFALTHEGRKALRDYAAAPPPAAKP